MASLLGGLGVLLQVGALGFVIAFARAIEAGSDLTVPIIRLSFTPDEQARSLILVGGVVLLLLSTAAWCLYYSRSFSIKVAREYEEFSVIRLFALVGHLPHLNSPLASSQLSDRDLMRLQTDARVCGRVLRYMINSAVAIASALVALVAIFILDPLLSMVSILLVAISLIFLYRVSLKSVSFSRRFEKQRQPSIRERHRLLAHIKSSAAPLPENDPRLTAVLTEGSNRKYLDALEGRWRVLEYSSLVSNLLLGASIVIILFIQGRAVLTGAAVGEIAVYLVALNHFVRGIRNINRLITVTNRFYPQVKRFHDFVIDAQQALLPHAHEDRAEAWIVRAPSLNGTSSEALMPRSSRAALITGQEINRATLWPLMRAVTSAEGKAASPRLDMLRRGVPIPASLREIYGIPVDGSDEEVREIVADILGPEDRPIPSIDQRLREEDHEMLDLGVHMALSAAAVIARRAQVVIIEGKQLQQMAAQTRERMLRRLSDRVQIIALRSPAGVIDETLLDEDDPVLIANADNVAGWATKGWVIDNLLRLNELLRTNRFPTDARMDEEDPDYEEDEDDF